MTDAMEGLKPAIYDVELTFTTELLGSSPSDPAVYADYIASNAEQGTDTSDEVETLPVMVHKVPDETFFGTAGMSDDEIRESLRNAPLMEVRATVAAPTVFHRMPDGDGRPCLVDYQIKGFFKETCGALRRVSISASAKITAYKKIVDGMVFIEPRFLALDLAGGTEIGVLSRPLRAQTAQGERIAIASSEMIPAGATVRFQILTLSDKVIPQALLEEWLSYGALKGLGQWRNASYGRFTYTINKR